MPEIRGIWIARWDMASPEACHDIVRLSKQYNINSLFVQVRGRGDALYKSRYEPPYQDMSSPDFDPLALFVKEGHEAGLQVHAWLNVNYLWDSTTLPVSPMHIVNKHPEWLMHTDKNEVNMVGGDDVEGAYTCPSNEEFREHLKNVYLDVVKNYDVDGVHFDFVRYPSSRFCYCDRCLGMFKAEMDAKTSPEERIALENSPDRIAYTYAYPNEWDDYRRMQINKIVYKIHDAVKAIKPNLIVSASVFPGFDDAYNHRFQDWKRWMKDGKLDMLCPMAYSTATDAFATDVKDAVDSSGGVPVVAGIGSWQISASSTIEKIKKARELGVAGFSMFSWAVTNMGTDETYLKKLRDEAYPEAVYLPLVGVEAKK